MAETVYVRGSRSEIVRAIQQAAEVASGRIVGGASQAASALQTRIGLTALAHIRDAFVTKSRGGTDEAGLSWVPLAKSTVAYSRRHPGVPPGKKRAGFAPSWMLTAKQRKRWWQIYRSLLGSAPQGSEFHRFKPKGHEYNSHATAARRAWAILKAEGATTLMAEYGDTKVDILRDTGLLLNSLSPGVVGEVPNQVFKVGQGDVIIGTNRKWASVHHHGNARIPQRRLWPEPSQWPQSWWADVNEQARAGFIDIVVYLLRNQ